MESEVNKRTMLRILSEVLNGADIDLADELYAQEHELHPQSPGVTRGPEGMKSAFRGLHEEFPDIEVSLDSMVAEGDMVAVRLTFRGTHAPTGRAAVWPEMVFTRFENGRAVESWEVTDTGRAWDAPPW